MTNVTRIHQISIYLFLCLKTTNALKPLEFHVISLSGRISIYPLRSFIRFLANIICNILHFNIHIKAIGYRRGSYLPIWYEKVPRFFSQKNLTKLQLLYFPTHVKMSKFSNRYEILRYKQVLMFIYIYRNG